METLTNSNQTNEETLCFFINDFFDCRKLPEHLIFLDYWMEKVIINKSHKKHLNIPDLLFFSDKFSNLLTACHEVFDRQFESSIKITKEFIIKEQRMHLFYPNYLKTKELCNPILVFQSIFKSHPLDFYKKTIQNWVNIDLSVINEFEFTTQIFPAYRNLKRMVEACWLIHERTNRTLLTNLSLSTSDFSLSCPLLLKDEYLNNPYLMIESFFSFANIDEYKEDLTQWFKVALNDQCSYDSPSDLLFIHNQFTQLIHAGYLINTSKLVYEPSTKYTKNHETFGHWLLARMGNQYTIKLLSPAYKENPYKFCDENLTLNDVIKLRYGLKEWLEAALSKNTNITGLEHIYIFDQFEELQKIMEALFLLIIQPVLKTKN